MKVPDQMKSMIDELADQLVINISAIGMAIDLLKDSHPFVIQHFETLTEQNERKIAKAQKFLK
jgi:hypothetical protein